jgi:hypothetical protein
MQAQNTVLPLTRIALAILFAAISAQALPIISLSPSSGSLSLGQTFQVDAVVNGLDPNNLPYDYSFDLAYDASVLALQSIAAGTLYDCGDLCFSVSSTSPGQILGVGAFDLFQTLTATDGVLASFDFTAIASSSGTDLSLSNGGLQSLDSAATLGGFDIASGLTASGTLSVEDPTAAPEPGTAPLILAALGAVLCAVGAQRTSRLRRTT